MTPTTIFFIKKDCCLKFFLMTPLIIFIIEKIVVKGIIEIMKK